MTRLHIFGDSHVEALEAAHKRSTPSETWPFEPAFYGRDGRNWITFDWRELNGTFHVACDVVPKARPLAYAVDDKTALYVFSSPLFSGTTYLQDTWHRSCPWERLDANPDLHGISTAVIETFVEHQLKHRFDLLERVKATGYSIAIVEPPKPLRRTPTLFGIRPDVLTAVDHIHRRYASARLKQIGIPIICVPDDTHASGFTTDEYAHKNPADTHHANAKFGARMMTQVMKYGLGTCEPSSGWSQGAPEAGLGASDS